MKKVTLVLLEQEKNRFLKVLKKMGLVHLKSTPVGKGEKLESLQKKLSRVQLAAGCMDNSVKSKNEIFNKEIAMQIAEDVISMDTRIKELHSRLTEISGQIERLVPYGEFEPADISILRSKGIHVLLFKGSRKLMDEVSKAGGEVFLLKRSKKMFFAAGVFSSAVPEKIQNEALNLPEYGVIELRSVKAEIEAEILKLKETLKVNSARKGMLIQYADFLEQCLLDENLLTGMDGKENLSWITGFIPADAEDHVRETARKKQWALIIKNPDPEEPVPTLVRNAASVRIIAPLFSFLNTLPGYKEIDVSLYFLTYFVVFFAMIIGDAGYGALLLTGSLLTLFKSRSDVSKLLVVLSFSAVVWGTITGNWFGSRAIAEMNPFFTVTIPSIATFPDLFPGVEAKDPQKIIMLMCFILGLSQLTLANLINFFRTLPSIQAFTHIGWGGTIFGLYFLVVQFVLKKPMPDFALPTIIAGLSLVVIFGQQEKNEKFFKGLAKGLGGLFITFLDAVGGFSNIISYIRLFAVGMSSFYVALSFNNLGQSLMEGWTLPLGLLVILIGHALNLMMAALSVMVHGIRLNMLEFSGQLGLEWMGFKYSPYRTAGISGNST